MMGRSCSRYAELEAELRRKSLSESTTSHAADCEICSAALLADRLLQELDQATAMPPRLSQGEALWWRSRVLRRLKRDRAREDRRPTRLVALLVSIMPLLVVVSTLGWALHGYADRVAPLLLPFLISGVILVATPVLAWLSLWLADEVSRPT